MNRSKIIKVGFSSLVVLMLVCLLAPLALAQEDHEEAAASAGGDSGNRAIGLGIGAGIAVGLAGLATGLAQSGVGAGGTGAIAEKPELFGRVLVLFAIPETIVILGFVIAFLLLNQL